MGFIQTIIDQHQKKVQERNDACNDLISRIDDALRDAKSIFSAPQAFIDPRTEPEWRSRNSGILADSEAHKILRLKKATKYKMDKNSDLTELTPYALRELVKAVYVEAPDKSSGKRKQKIHISYDLIGFIPVDALLKKAEQA